jgi:hypothetical protein
MQTIRRIILTTAFLGAALVSSTASAQAIWASNTQQSREHCNPQAVLWPGDTLWRGQSMWSANGRYQLAMQDDGNLVIYHHGLPLWATGTNGIAVERAVMQYDGNFVLYDYTGRPRWASNTHGNHGARLVLQCDGNLVIYR